MVRVTLDSDVFPVDELLAAAAGRQIEFVVVSVTERELSGTSFEVSLADLRVVSESAVWDESEWDNATFADDCRSSPDLDMLLAVIGSGSFPPPGQRGELTKGQSHQLRDAMILEAHLRAHRDILVSGDARAFIRHGRREQLAAMTGARIMTRIEFLNWLHPPTA